MTSYARQGIVIFLMILCGIGAGFHYANISDPAPTGKQATNTKSRVRLITPEASIKFHWSQIESQNLTTYKENLRGVGCPDRTINSIIRGIVLRRYQAKVNAIFNPLAHFWSSQSELDELDRRIKGIRAERDNLLASLGLTSNEVDVNGLSQEKQQFVNKALDLYPKNMPAPGASDQEWSDFLTSRRARVNYLSQYLSPEELLAYRINSDGNASGIANLLSSINPSEEEYKSVFISLDGENLNTTNGLLTPDLEAKLKLALGDQRYAEYQEQTTLNNVVWNTFAQFSNLSAAQLNQLEALRANYGDSPESKFNQDYQNAVLNIVGNRTEVERFFSNPFLYIKTK